METETWVLVDDNCFELASFGHDAAFVRSASSWQELAELCLVLVPSVILDQRECWMKLTLAQSLGKVCIMMPGFASSKALRM